MRIFTVIFLLTIVLGCAGTKNASTKSSRLNGSWIPIKQEFGGTALPNASYEKQKLTISDSTYTFFAESIDKGVLKYTDGKMDIYGKEGVNSGKHFRAKYTFENEQLTICYNLAGDIYPDSFDTKGKPMYFLSVYKKE